MMDIHELMQFESAYKPSKEVAFCWLRKQYVQLSTEENHTEIVDHANDSLRIWQAAKAQAVPELTDKMIVAIESEVENQLKASAIDADPFRLDGEKIWYAALEAKEQANDKPNP